MNEAVAKIIEEQKKKQEKEQKKHKEKYLLNLGLVDFSKSKKKYCIVGMSEADRKYFGYIHHDDNGYFRYEGKPTALDISDEDYKELRKWFPEEPEKICPKEPKSIIYAENIASINKHINKFALICIITNLLILSSNAYESGLEFRTDYDCSVASCCLSMLAMILSFTSQLLDTAKTSKIFTFFGIISFISLMAGLLLMCIGVWLWV